ncbi:hypothetical protein ACP5SM_004743, partial [Salmonella enterica subsp. enterica serovar Infantis]
MKNITMLTLSRMLTGNGNAGKQKKHSPNEPYQWLPVRNQPLLRLQNAGDATSSAHLAVS